MDLEIAIIAESEPREAYVRHREGPILCSYEHMTSYVLVCRAQLSSIEVRCFRWPSSAAILAFRLIIMCREQRSGCECSESAWLWSVCLPCTAARHGTENLIPNR